ncbi:MAG: sigma-54-dependent Fis family transcriptional regulator [Gammaproteobacteria bacterium]|nr:sigma-54-dependent Fis family transcriptional regulator [Gammaproteobacteria bacterium]NIR98379.1 sigma-54-dependent Fis family transcriptional regulator [Gammaproteobacteria bacterium]NIT64133.1 sigma-54-dependent Fis family transcriptional regulator [Gammaproteobacteria bacterium]NIV21070.1 response regulator [Gammaproteobacteria bacterium]NIY32713.1 response regulator [Gammaproteobacteria bacterium]
MRAAYILVVDDEPDIRTLVQEILEDEGYEVGVAEDGEAARRHCRARRPDLVLLDIWMPDVDGVTLLKEWREGEGVLPFPVIMMSGHGTVETAVEATRLGAHDFVEKPLSLAKLLITVERALEADRLKQENVGLRRQAQPLVEPAGKSTAMQRLREQIKRIASHDTWVLINGEPGVGKRTFARYLHHCSLRREGPFIEMGVGTIARENSAVELFGSEEDGTIHYGRLEQANGGALLLDEVADMDIETQTRLLSALEGRSFMRVGGTEPVEVDVRVVATTHRDMEQEVHEGRFREDLFYQLNVVPLHVPPLREHCEDVPELLAFYVDQFVQQDNLPYRRFTVAAQNRLRNYPWPGNIRELKNLVQRMLILGAGEQIDVEEVDTALSGQPERPVPAVSTAALDLPLREAREQFEREYLQHQLAACGGSVGRLSKLVGMERTNLYRKLRALGIDVKQK